ncbi:MAG: hypothetical protein K2H52_06245 [Lachnospiraceae bacterium]|nr:hypothetical protein [Lachnospiraceae bacterium]
MKKVNDKIKSFVENNDVMQYIFSGKVKQDVHILECISYIDLDSLSKAKEVAEKCVISGDTGRFENEGKGFFELVMRKK